VEDTERFRGGLVFKAHRLVHHSILGWRVIQKKKRTPSRKAAPPVGRGGGEAASWWSSVVAKKAELLWDLNL